MNHRLALCFIAAIPLFLSSSCSNRHTSQQAKVQSQESESSEATTSLETETLQAFPRHEKSRSYYSASRSGEFPRPPELEPQVRFWKNSYANWSRSQVAIHDKQYMDLVYEVFQLPGEVGESLNPYQKDYIQERMSFWRNQLSDIEDKLSSGSSLSADERRLMNQIAELAGGRTAIYGAGQRLRYQRGLRERFKRGLAIGSRYDRKFRDIFRNAGLPEDLAYLPHVESSFQYNAHSSAGALGIWQFTSGAARIFMNGDDSAEARLDPIASTYGAARYLSSAYDKLGSWPLAITSYNHGIGGMQRARNRHGHDFVSIVKHYDHPQFGFASRNYYAEFLAARDIASNPESYFPEGIYNDGGAVVANASLLADSFATSDVKSSNPFSEVSFEASSNDSAASETSNNEASATAESSATDPTPTETPAVPQTSESLAADDTPFAAQKSPNLESLALSSQDSGLQDLSSSSETVVVNGAETEPADAGRGDAATATVGAAPQTRLAGESRGTLSAANGVPTDLFEGAEEVDRDAGHGSSEPAPAPQVIEPPEKLDRPVKVETLKSTPSVQTPQAVKTEPKKVAPPVSERAIKPEHPAKSVAAPPKAAGKGGAAKAVATLPEKVPPKSSSKGAQPNPEQAVKNLSAAKEKTASPAPGNAQRAAPQKTGKTPAPAPAIDQKMAASKTSRPVASGGRTERPAEVHAPSAKAQPKPHSK